MMILFLLSNNACFKRNVFAALLSLNSPAHFSRCRLIAAPLRDVPPISTGDGNHDSFSSIIGPWKRRRFAVVDTKYRWILNRALKDQPSTLFTSVSNDDQIDTTSVDFRKNLLRQQLVQLGCFNVVSDFENAVLLSIVEPTSGYDLKYGKSAIKTCQTFYYPKTIQSYDTVQWEAAAMRTARQIEFLYKRHVAQQTQWIRNHDTKEDTEADQISLTATRPRFPFVLLLDNLRSAENVGSIYRTADATRCQEVMTVGITPHPPGHQKIHKSALGAEFLVPTQHFSNATAVIQYMQQKYSTYQVLALETTSESIPYTQFPYEISESNGIILMLGNEVTGLDVSSYLSNHSLDGIIEIPMYGTKNSLNVAVCVPIVIYEIIRQWKR
jgi:23S rRNA (guanosine2251-2'-O)-methyltransferase